jgi:hypothetical protein
VGLGVEADGEGSLVLDEVEEESSASEATVGDDDPEQGWGSQVEDVIDELLLDLVLAVVLGD